MGDHGSMLLAEPCAPQAVVLPAPRDQPASAPGTWALTLAAGLVLISGLVLFGWDALRVAGIGVGSAVLIDWAARAALGRGGPRSAGSAVLVGLLIACTLPPTASWPVPLVAAGVAVLAGQFFAGRPGNCLWHPVALGRVAVQLLFPQQLSPARWAVLGPGSLLWGDLAAAHPLSPPATWASQPLPYGVAAWEVTRPADVLAAAVPAHADATPAGALAALVRDVLPPWSHTLIGVAGGSIGEACGMAVILAGLLLMWRGLTRWSLPVAGVLTGAIVAAVLPVAIQPQRGAVVWHWLPGLVCFGRLPVGLLYVLYNLTAGELLLVVMLLAADPTRSPRTARGQALVGAMIGGSAMALRTLTGPPAAGYWALLIANTLVRLADVASRQSPKRERRRESY